MNAIGFQQRQRLFSDMFQTPRKVERIPLDRYCPVCGEIRQEVPVMVHAYGEPPEDLRTWYCPHCNERDTAND